MYSAVVIWAMKRIYRGTVNTPVEPVGRWLFSRLWDTLPTDVAKGLI